MHTNVKLNRPIKCGVLTISDTRNYDTDKGGKLVQALLSEIGITISTEYYKIVKDDKITIESQIEHWLATDLDVIITTGGTGIAQRDVTIEAVSPYLTKQIEGFGELFRYLSYVKDVGTRAMLSRAIAGAHNDKLIFCLPGSTGAVKLAIEELIKPEMTHLIKELTK